MGSHKDTIKKLYVEPVSICNLSCRMCFRNNWIKEESGIMSQEVLDRVYESIAQLHHVKVIFSGMGEPLLHPDIVGMVKQAAQKDNKTEIITNATLLDENMGNELICAGLNCLWVSLDASHIESAKNLQAIENIKYFHKVREKQCDLGLTYVVSDGNPETIKEIEILAKHLHVDKVNISQMIPCERIDHLTYRNKVPIGTRNVDCISEILEPKFNYCPFIEEGSTFIKWNGEIVPCIQLLHSSYTYLFDEKRAVYSYSFGNIKSQLLSEIYDSELYVQFRERVKKFEFPDCTMCDGCDDRKENKTDCMYNEMPTCGACLWAQNIARCP